MSKENALFPMVKDAIAFETLWQQVTEQVKTLSGDVWTDIGEHDPGVTLLQSATWNCSDLSYRASLPLNDLLTRAGEETLFPQEFGPDRVLTCNAVTIEDYRRILLDLHSSDIPLATIEQDFLFSDVWLIKEPEESRFHWWYNAEKREYSFTEPTDVEGKQKLTLRGNSWLSVIPTRFTQSLPAEDRAKVVQCLNDFLVEHRNLGEQVSHVSWLKPVTFSPRITIELAENVSDINQVAAQIYQVTEAFLRPTATRYTTEQRRALGDDDEVIFEGPLLQHGWQQSTPSRISPDGITINLSPLVNQLLAIPGVASLGQLSVDPLPEHVTAIAEDSWSWQVASGYFPHLWGDNPLALLAGDDSPLTFIAKGGIYSRPTELGMADYLTVPELIQTEPTVLPAGRLRNLAAYTPVGQRLPECYQLQQPDSVIDDTTRALHQFLLSADQLFADGSAELALLPELLAFKQRGNAIRGTRWPYATTSVQQDVHQSYADTLTDFQQRNAAIFMGNDPTLNQANFARELNFLDYLLGYFGSQRAALPLTLDMPDFLATQRAYLAQQPALGYDRVNIRIDQVSALQKRIAARIGLDSTCFAENPDLSQLPFYLIEHRQLLPQTPDSSFDSEQTLTDFTVAGSVVTLTQSGIAGKVTQGQLIDLVVIEGENRRHISRLLVTATDGESFSVSANNSQQLKNSLARLQSAWNAGNLRWQNSNVWLQDMNYRLNYAADAQQPANPQQRLLASNAQTPYPSMVSIGDVIVLHPTSLQFSRSDDSKVYLPVAENEWQLEATIKAIDPVTGTLLIEKAADSSKDFPLAEESFRYQWNFSQANYATTDRFSFVVSAVHNRRLIENKNIVPDKLIAWMQETIMTEFPAHISLINHWLDDAAFKNFGATYKRWQNNGTPLGDDAFAIMQMLTLGHLPAVQLDIGLMRIATEAQRTQVIGSDGDEWHDDIILSEELLYIPRDISSDS